MNIPALLAVGAVSALTLTACGGTGSGSATQQGAPAPGATSTQGLHVGTTSLGKVVVDGQGHTVYVLTADGKDHATCDAGCQHYWPPIGQAKARGVAATVGTTALPGGGATATVGGLPVYTYSGDQKAGEVNGEGVEEFGGTWYAVSASGTAITGAGAAADPSSGPGYVGRGY